MTNKLSPWSLTDLFPGLDAPELESAFKDLETQVASFEKLRPQLKADMPVSSFLEIVKDSEESTKLAYKLYSFASLSFAANTQDQSILALLGRIQQFMAELENRTLFFSLWWKDLDDANAKRMLDASGDYRYYLEEIRHFKPHTLSEAEEKVVNLKNVTGSNALITLYDAITNRYVYTVEVDGEKKEMTRGELSIYIRGADPDLRAKAYQELYRVYSADGPILGQMYQTAARDWRNENLSLRKFTSPIAARNLGNDIPDEAVEALLKVCEKNANMFQRYFRLKAKFLNIPRLRRYDIYAPLVKSNKAYAFDQAAGMVLESFTAFHPEFGKLARRVFDANHLDSEVRK
jgi:oligoendopeptidase F